MAKRIIITDTVSGVVETDETVEGGFSLQYTKNTDEGNVHILGRINNGKFGYRHWIANEKYEPLAKRLVRKFEELSHIKSHRILFLEDTLYEFKASKKPDWVAKVKKAPKELAEIWGYWYVMEIRKDALVNMTSSQRTAIIYHELRHVGHSGELLKHDIEDWDNMVTTLGKDWVDGTEEIWNILDEHFDWDKPRKQLSIYDFNKNVAGA